MIRLLYYYSSGDATNNLPPLQSANFQFSLSTTSFGVNALSADFDANLGPDAATFLTVPASDMPASMAFGTTLDFFGSTPFAYDPAFGNLLLDIAVTGLTNPLGNEFNGLITGFSASQTVVPEPMTIGLLATGLVGIAGAARRRRQPGISDDC